MDAIRVMSSEHGKIYACLQSFKSGCQTITSESNALSIGCKIMLRTVEHGK